MHNLHTSSHIFSTWLNSATDIYQHWLQSTYLQTRNCRCLHLQMAHMQARKEGMDGGKLALGMEHCEATALKHTIFFMKKDLFHTHSPKYSVVSITVFTTYIFRIVLISFLTLLKKMLLKSPILHLLTDYLEMFWVKLCLYAELYKHKQSKL